MATSKGAAVARLRGVRQAGTSARAEVLYPGSTSGRRGVGWSRSETFPNDNLPELATLVARSRRAMNYDPYARGIILALVTDTVGWGINPVCLAENRKDKEAIERAWDRWVETSDPWGKQLDFYGQQWLITWSWLVSGEVFVRLRRRRPGDGTVLQLEVLEPEFCPRNWNSPLASTPRGHRVRAGIEFDPIGNVAAYYMYRNRPGDLQDIDPTQLVRVPANIGASVNVLHVYRPERPGQLRGTPALAPVLMRLRDLEVFTDAVLVRQGLSNLLTASWTRAASDTLEPITGEARDETAADDRPLVRIGVGALNELAPGEDLKYNDPPEPAARYQDFVKSVLRAAASAGTGVPYEVLTSDWSGANDRLARVVLHGHRRKIQAIQFHVIVKALCSPVYREWMRAEVDSGALQLDGYYDDPEKYAAASWSPQAWPYINPTQDVAAQEQAVRNGFTSRTAVVSETGERAEVIDAQQAEDNARADELGLKYDSDGRNKKTNAAAVPGQPNQAAKEDEGDGSGDESDDDDVVVDDFAAGGND